MTVLAQALTGGSSKNSLAQKEGYIPGRPENLQQSNGLEALQKEALSDTDKQLADLHQKRAQKRARMDNSAAEMRQ